MLAILSALSLLVVPLRAEEGGSGHYMPGATASFIDALPGRTSVAAVPTYTYYQGSAARNIPIIGGVALNLDATVHAVSVPLIYQTPLKLVGGHYAAGVVLPYVSVETKGGVTFSNPTLPSGFRRDTADGLGDVALLPFMLGWTRGDLKYDVRLSVFAPTGNYDRNDLANVGKNYWSFDPEITVSYLGSKTGLEASAFAGVCFNLKNEETDYQTGSQFHLDVTVAEHLPLGKLGVVGLGANGFLYQQLSGDSGSGAVLGDFEGRSLGVGPVLSYVTKVGKTDLLAELKWLPEMDVEHRLKGDYLWLKVALAF
ncbi:MAG: transporter [Verrucomicrobiae bacterium]|nr:transporter [Verrucomicrobiae bacterium]MCP5523151.1 transporter [Verrucomicrobiales bacterium]